jgi:collagenase-like PrtC family protease
VHSATAYVSEQSVDPLVVGPNVTTRSDARIFASDGNATIAALAKSPGLFLATCGALLARMLDTVPRDVVLTEVIEPLPVKPADLSLIMHSDDNSFLLSASVRVRRLAGRVVCVADLRSV